MNKPPIECWQMLSIHISSLCTHYVFTLRLNKKTGGLYTHILFTCVCLLFCIIKAWTGATWLNDWIISTVIVCTIGHRGGGGALDARRWRFSSNFLPFLEGNINTNYWVSYDPSARHNYNWEEDVGRGTLLMNLTYRLVFHFKWLINSLSRVAWRGVITKDSGDVCNKSDTSPSRGAKGENGCSLSPSPPLFSFPQIYCTINPPQRKPNLEDE